jgi:hypothetical protein
MADRYFVTIHASDEREFRRLLDYDFDLFATRKGEGDRDYAVDGLIRLEDVGRLVDDGYQVLVGEPDTPKEPPRVARADEWLKGTLEDFEAEQRRSK